MLCMGGVGVEGGVRGRKGGSEKLLANNPLLFSLELARLGKDFLMFKVLEASFRKGSAAFFSAVRQIKMLPIARDSGEAQL